MEKEVVNGHGLLKTSGDFAQMSGKTGAPRRYVLCAVSALVMTGLVIVGLFFRPRQRLFRTAGWVSLALFTVYPPNSDTRFLHSE